MHRRRRSDGRGGGAGLTAAAPDLTLTFERDGAQHFPGVATDSVERLRSAFAGLPTARAGTRLSNLSFARDLIGASGAVGSIASSVIGHAAKPVRAVYFDKSADMNWSLGWHQDRVIGVRERLEAPGFTSWTTKAGLVHVSPPFEILAAMVTLRLHLDDVGEDNAPLLIAPGSHTLGRVEESEIDFAAKQCGVFACLADSGDVWLYATPILHASKAAVQVSHRRVLQLDYAACELPSGLEWQTLT